jgi:hypothetical protein
MIRRSEQRDHKRAADTVVQPITMRSGTLASLRELRALEALCGGHRGKLATYNYALSRLARSRIRTLRARLLRQGMTAAEIEAALVAAGVRETGEGRSKAEKRAALPDESAPVPRVD